MQKQRQSMVDALVAGLPQYLKYVRAPQEHSLRIDSEETLALAAMVGKVDLLDPEVVTGAASFVTLRDQMRDFLAKDCTNFEQSLAFIHSFYSSFSISISAWPGMGGVGNFGGQSVSGNPIYIYLDFEVVFFLFTHSWIFSESSLRILWGISNPCFPQTPHLDSLWIICRSGTRLVQPCSSNLWCLSQCGVHSWMARVTFTALRRLSHCN